jgi:hypothetical protein
MRSTVRDLRHSLTWLAFAAATLWLARLYWLEARGRIRHRGQKLLLAAPALALLAAIAFLIYGCR